MSNSQERFLAELEISHLPSLPHVLVELLHACQDLDSTFQEISTIISRDAAIAARVVGLANSPFYSRGVKINSLERALLVLGTDTIKTIVITASVQQFFSSFSKTQSDFLSRFWRRSLSCALLAKSLAILTSYPNPEEAYLTGLLHNIGELILKTNHETQYLNLLSQAPQDDQALLQREHEAFGVNPSTVGAWMSREWGVGSLIADAREFHHAPAEMLMDAHHLVKIVALSSLLSEDPGSPEDQGYEIAEDLFELNPSLVSEISRKIRAEVVAVAKSMAIRIDLANDDLSADQEKQVALARQIRNLSLLQTARGELCRADSKTSLGVALQNTLSLLFGFSSSAVFWYNKAENELSFMLPAQDETPVPIRFRMEPNRSLVAQAGLSRTILCSLDNATPQQAQPVVDQQICRFVRKPGLLCLPVYDDEHLYCVLVAGVHARLSDQNGLQQRLRYFLLEAAASCRAGLLADLAHPDNATIQAMAQRANEIAHEANNPLSIINNYLGTLAKKLGAHEDVKEELAILREELERTGQILIRLNDLKASTVDSLQGVDINHEIKSLVTLYRSSLFLSHDIQCTLALDPQLKKQSASSHSMRQILTNLMKNAVEAMPDGGELSIRTNHCVNVDGKDYVEILIQDNGPGIPDPVLRNLFKPVASTKGKQHSGLGLSITKNLVKDARGTIRCRSSSQGTEFQILLPGGAQD